MSRTTEETKGEVILCPRCSGVGRYSVIILEDYRRGLYKETTEECKYCNSIGRLYKVTKTYDVEFKIEDILEAVLLKANNTPEYKTRRLFKALPKSERDDLLKLLTELNN
jgi:hypothetical protein